jgi:hypothetical protein
VTRPPLIPSLFAVMLAVIPIHRGGEFLFGPHRISRQPAAFDIATASDDDLVQAWRAYADKISYHHADDSGKEWGLALAIMPRAREIETTIRQRGLGRPTGQYLMSADERIDWDTGDWSPGWTFKKLAAHREARS